MKNHNLIFQPRPAILYNQKTSLNTVNYESAQRDQLTLHKLTEASIARTSLYQQRKHCPTQPLAKQANKSKSARLCPGCRSHSHGQRESNDYLTKCPAWGRFCNHCKIPHHFSFLCQQKPSESASALIAQVYYDSQSDAYHTILPIQDINEIPALIASTKSNHCNRSPVLINIFPNSGASICLVGPHHLQQLNLKREHLISCHKEVKAVGGSKLICHGWLPINFTLGKHTATQQVYFCGKVDHFYFSKKGCLDIHILPSQFPYPMDIANSAHTSPASVAAASTTQIKPPADLTTLSPLPTTTINTTTSGYSCNTNSNNTFLVSFVIQHLIVPPCFQ